jgi:predicted MFS family arabinose efflux permease
MHDHTHPAPQPAEPRSSLLVWALSGAQLVSWGVLYYGFSLFVVPMENELGWSRTTLNGALSLGLLAAGLSAYPVGNWIDRHGGRWLMTAGTLLGVAMLFAWSQVTDIVLFHAIWIGIGIAQAATLYEPAFVVLTRLYHQSFRTKITLMTLVGGLASTVFIPLIQLLIDTFGWRTALILLAVIVAVCCLPVHAFLLRDREAGGTTSQDGPPLLGRAAVKKAMRSPVFWGLMVCFIAYYATFSALAFHIVPMLTDRGFATATVVGIVAVIGPSQVAGRILLLVLGRHVRVSTVGRVVMFAFPVSALLLLFLPYSLTAMFAFAVLYGIANGIMTIVRGTSVPDLMWREGYGAINGALSLPSTIAKAASPFVAALLWSWSGGYEAVLWAICAGGTIAVCAFWFATHVAGRNRKGAIART